MNIFHKKSFRIGVAGVMAVVLICLGILVNPEDVTANCIEEYSGKAV